MDQGDIALLLGKSTQIDDPDVRQAGSNEDAGQACWVSNMTLVELEAATFLVREEGFNAHAFAIPVANLVGQSQIGDEKDRCWVGFVPPEHDGDGTVGLLAEGDLLQAKTEVGPGVLVQLQPRPLAADPGIFGSAADVVPALVGQIALQLDAIKLTAPASAATS